MKALRSENNRLKIGEIASEGFELKNGVKAMERAAQKNVLKVILSN